MGKQPSAIMTAVAAFVLLLTGCTADEDEPPPHQTAPLGTITDNTNSAYFTIAGGTADTDIFGDWQVTLGFNISNANGIAIDPVIAVEYADGTTVTCTEEDLRRKPHLVESTTDWRFPCDGTLRPDEAPMSVTVTDDYH